MKRIRKRKIEVEFEMSDDESEESLDEFESVDEELSVESEIVEVSDVSLSSESSSPSELDKERLFDIDNVELMMNPVGDVDCYSDDETELSDYAEAICFSLFDVLFDEALLDRLDLYCLLV